MTSVLNLFWPDFEPAPTVENFGARTGKDVEPGDDRQREKELDELLDRPRALEQVIDRPT